MIVKKAEKILIKIVRVFDYPILVLVVPFCLAGFLFARPWILKQRKIWNQSVKGSPKALMLRGFTVEKVDKRGYAQLLPFRNPSLEWIGILDASNVQQINIKIADDLYLFTWRSPKFVRVMEEIGFSATAILFRETIAVFKITSYCVREKIGLLRAYKHDYPALQAYLVSKFIKIPFIVDIIGNFELIRKLTGNVYYFRNLNRLPFIENFARPATNWLLGLPLRHAARVLGRDKSTYEHAFSLGAPVEKLAFIRLSNFNSAFKSYNPERPPDKPASYPYFLFVGRLVEIKFPLDVIAAFDLAAAHLPEYRLVIIGDGRLGKKVRQRIELSKYKDRIVLLGACSSDIVLNWTAHAKAAICLLAGYTVVEAMFCGIPVIAYFFDGLPELVIDRYTGYIVPFRNINALAEKMIYVSRNFEEAKIVGMRGHELAHISFDQDNVREKESMYYKQALTETSS